MGGGGGLLEAHADKALRGQVVDLVGLHFLHQRNGGTLVGQVVFNQVQLRVAQDAQFLHAPEIDGAGAAIGAIDGVAFFEQQLGKISAVLASNTGDDCFFVHFYF